MSSQSPQQVSNNAFPYTILGVVGNGFDLRLRFMPRRRKVPHYNSKTLQVIVIDHCKVLTLFAPQISIATSNPNKPTLAGVEWDFPLVLDELAGENKPK